MARAGRPSHWHLWQCGNLYAAEAPFVTGCICHLALLGALLPSGSEGKTGVGCKHVMDFAVLFDVTKTSYF